MYTTLTTPSEDARYARAELERIAAALSLAELVRLIQLGERMMGAPSEVTMPRGAHYAR